MPESGPRSELHRVLAEIQRRGGIGRGPIDAGIVHALQFVDAIPAGAHSLADLGSGGGLPGLVIAWMRPELEVILIERRAKRADLLRYGVRALDLGERVDVHEGDVLGAHQALRRQVDVVTARSFGRPDVVLPAACTLVVAGGLILISEPPELVSRWDDSLLEWCSVTDEGRTGGIHRFCRRP
jgi:16S rRNA G527 N7-methylase RsmG